MIAKYSVGDWIPRRSSSSLQNGSGEVWCTSGGGPFASSVSATGVRAIIARSSRNCASPPVTTPIVCSPAAIARQRSLKSVS